MYDSLLSEKEHLRDVEQHARGALYAGVDFLSFRCPGVMVRE